MYIICGLGNPGEKYVNTRHNAGFEVIDALSRKYDIPVTERKHLAFCGKGMIEGMKVLLVKPQTFMNLSGESLRSILRYYDEPIENVLVICDDVYLDMGVLRIRDKGSSGGHNGLKNIIKETGSQDFKRIRVGVGKQPENMDLISFVMAHFTKAEKELMDETYEIAAQAAVSILRDGTYTAMNFYNGKRQQG